MVKIAKEADSNTFIRDHLPQKYDPFLRLSFRHGVPACMGQLVINSLLIVILVNPLYDSIGSQLFSSWRGMFYCSKKIVKGVELKYIIEYVI